MVRSSANGSEPACEGRCVCSKKGHFARDCWYQTDKGGGKGKKGEKGEKVKGRTANPKMETPRREDLATTATRLDTLLAIVQRRKESNKSNSSGGRDLHCLTCTDVQSQWVMMLAEIDHDCESSGDVESLVDPGAACHAWPRNVKSGSSEAGTFLTATGTRIVS